MTINNLAVLATALLLSPPSGARPQTPAEQELVLMAHIPAQVRVALPVVAQVLIYNPEQGAAALRLERLEVSVAAHGDRDAYVVGESFLDQQLPGGAEYGAIQALLERLPHEVTELHRPRRYFAAEDQAEFTGTEVLERWGEASRRVQALREAYAAGQPEPFVQPQVIVPLDQVFAPETAAGTNATLNFTVSYRTAAGVQRTASTTRTLTYLAAAPSLPTSLTALGTAASVHPGDLHVHSCYGEALGACGDGNCLAETLQLSGSFTYAELKPQYQALGLDWFTATEHSYCVNSSSEYQEIVANTGALTDADFICIPDTELSSDEEGSQVGSDIGNTVCIWLTEANHMGAHGITSRVPGGDDALFGFCDGLFSDALEGFHANIATIRSQGGYPIVNHPMGSFGWNSYDEARGIEAGALHGVEIWNGGGNQTGQGGHVARWIDWLLDGRILYCYSGSDTHDEAFAFGANHAVLTGGAAFTEDNLEDAIKNGQVYLSNGPALALEVELGGQALFMGSLHPLPAGAPAAALTVRAGYNFGAGTGTVTLFSGRVGAGSETELCQSGSLTGEGLFECSDTLTTDSVSWYRAYLEFDDGSRAAYTNPVFFIPSSDNTFNYCTAKPNSDGCTPGTTWSGTPSSSAGSGFTIGAERLTSGQPGIMIYGYAPLYLPFQDGTLCIGAPITRTPVQSSGGSGPCGGSMSFDFNTWIASGVDPGLTAGTTVYAQHWYRDPGAAFPTGLTDAIQFTLEP
ncbi:MAG: hypothetical protein CMK00_00410 [Planctomycetes bacterium]|jgi:hypothetical protein|nr:hypothetical protein [Planctomycetota bacterium]